MIRISWSAIVCGCLLAGCGLIAGAQEDPGKTAADVRKTALSACLACRVPGLPKEAEDACAKLEPVCSALAGLCAPVPETLVAPPPAYGNKVVSASP